MATDVKKASDFVLFQRSLYAVGLPSSSHYHSLAYCDEEKLLFAMPPMRQHKSVPTTAVKLASMSLS